MTRIAVALAVGCACGRVGFDATARGDASGAPGDAAPDAAAFPSGLVARYPLDDTSFIDVVSGQAGTCFGTCPLVAAGHIGNALVFDGTSDCLAFADDGRFALAHLTVAVWANQTATAGTNGDTQVAKRLDVGTAVLDSWQLEDYADGSQAFTSNDGSPQNGQILSATGAIALGRWQHLALSFDGTTKRVYVDGTLRAQRAAGSIVYDGHAITLGCDDNVGVGEPFTGALDELEIYDRALADAEIAALAAR